jgi:hypothetical protein
MCLFAEEFFEAEIGEGVAIALFHGRASVGKKNHGGCKIRRKVHFPKSRPDTRI